MNQSNDISRRFLRVTQAVLAGAALLGVMTLKFRILYGLFPAALVFGWSQTGGS